MNELERDVRLLRRNQAKGFISQEKVDAILNKLPDVEGQAEWIDIEAEADSAGGEGDDG